MTNLQHFLAALVSLNRKREVHVASRLADQWAARFAQADSANHVSALARAMGSQQIQFVMIHLDGIGQSRLKTTSSAVSLAAAQRFHPLTERADSRAAGASTACDACDAALWYASDASRIATVHTWRQRPRDRDGQGVASLVKDELGRIAVDTMVGYLVEEGAW